MNELFYSFGVSVLSSIIAYYVCQGIDWFFHKHGKD